MCEAQCNIHFLYCLCVQYSLIQCVFIMETYRRKKLHAKCHRKFRKQFQGVSVSLKSSMSNSWRSRLTPTLIYSELHIYIYMCTCAHTCTHYAEIQGHLACCASGSCYEITPSHNTIGKAMGLTPQPVWQCMCP